VTDSYPDRVLGEVGIHHRARRLRYYGSADELQLAFDFGFWANPWDAAAFRASGLEQATSTFGWPTHALSNHDILEGKRFGSCQRDRNTRSNQARHLLLLGRVALGRPVSMSGRFLRDVGAGRQSVAMC